MIIWGGIIETQQGQPLLRRFAERIFADGFASGNTSAWSAVRPEFPDNAGGEASRAVARSARSTWPLSGRQGKGEDPNLMPDALKVLLALLPAVGLFFVIRLVVGRRIAQAVALARSEAAAERAGVEERLRGREEQLTELRGALAAKERA